MAYLELEPTIECRSPENIFYPCEIDHICEDGKMNSTDWWVDWSKPTSLHNWIDELNSPCLSHFKMGAFGSSYFIGTTVGSFMIKLNDRFGRKWITILASAITALFCYSNYFLGFTLYLKYLQLFLLGVAGGLKVITIYIITLELVPFKW